MPIERNKVTIMFNEGMDAGGEDPRIKKGGVLIAENLYPERSGLVARVGTTPIMDAGGVTINNVVRPMFSVDGNPYIIPNLRNFTQSIPINSNSSTYTTVPGKGDISHFTINTVYTSTGRVSDYSISSWLGNSIVSTPIVRSSQGCNVAIIGNSLVGTDDLAVRRTALSLQSACYDSDSRYLISSVNLTSGNASFAVVNIESQNPLGFTQINVAGSNAISGDRIGIAQWSFDGGSNITKRLIQVGKDHAGSKIVARLYETDLPNSSISLANEFTLISNVNCAYVDTYDMGCTLSANDYLSTNCILGVASSNVSAHISMIYVNTSGSIVAHTNSEVNMMKSCVIIDNDRIIGTSSIDLLTAYYRPTDVSFPDFITKALVSDALPPESYPASGFGDKKIFSLSSVYDRWSIIQKGPTSDLGEVSFTDKTEAVLNFRGDLNDDAMHVGPRSLGCNQIAVLFPRDNDDSIFEILEYSYNDGEFTISEWGNGSIISGHPPRYISSSGAPSPVGVGGFPRINSVGLTGNSIANAWTGNGTVGFVATVETVSFDGIKIRSSPTAISSVALSSQNSTVNVSVRLPTPFIMDERERAVVRLFCTEPNGTVFRECNSAALPSTIPNNDIHSFVNVIGSTNGDALYTMTQVENIYPVGHLCGTSYQDRYVYSDGRDIYYSKSREPLVSVEFNEFFTVRVPSGGGKIIALHQMDEKLIIFKESAIYSCYGEGFGPNLGGSNFSTPSLIAASVGCANRLCVVGIPQGIMFLSKYGIWLLARNEQLISVGGSVAHFTSQYDYTCAAVNQLKRYAIFTSGTSGAPALVYSHDAQTWSIFTGNYSGAKYITCDNNGRDFFGGNSKACYITNTNSSETFTCSLETGWYPFADTLGFMRWKHSALYLECTQANTNVIIKTAYDGDPYWQDNQTFNGTALAPYDFTEYYGAGTNASLVDQTYKLEFAGSRQKTDMVRHSFVVTNVTSGSVSFLGMAMDIAVRRGTVKLGGGKKI